MFGGDGGRCAADQTDPNYFYGEYVYLQIHRSVNGGASSSYIFSGIGDAGLPDPEGEPTPDGYPDPDAQANFIAPFIIDPNNANTLLGGGSNLWRSVNVKAGTPSWNNVFAIRGMVHLSAPLPSRRVTRLSFGLVSITAMCIPQPTAQRPVRPGLAGTWGRQIFRIATCTRLTIDPTNSSRVYATFGGFSSDNVYRTTDGGTTWANIATGLPAAPIRSLVIAPFNTNYLYVGTEVGVFASATGGASWSPANDGPANVSVEEALLDGAVPWWLLLTDADFLKY